MKINKLLEWFSNDGLTRAERVKFSKWKVSKQTKSWATYAKEVYFFSLVTKTQ